jgi:hypothetical protein
MQVVSYVFLPYTKNSSIFQSGKFVQPLTRSLASPYTEHGTPHFHTEHRLNRLPQHLTLIGYTKCACIEVAAETLSVSEMALHHDDGGVVHGWRVVNRLWFFYLSGVSWRLLFVFFSFLLLLLFACPGLA